MTNQKHTVATDALETLGTFPIPDNSGRDAIHLAVEPVVAGHPLRAGEHIALVMGKAYRTYGKHAIGIVDPFVKEWIEEGQRFWLVVLPRTITSLRHVWSHPAFPEEPLASYHVDADEHYVAPLQVVDKSASEKWMRDRIDKLSVNYYDDCSAEDMFDRVIETIEHAVQNGDRDICLGGDIDGDRELEDEFWYHFENYTGIKATNRPQYFRCAC